MPGQAQKPSMMSLQLGLKPDGKSAFSNWQAKLNVEVASFPGFVSLETTLSDSLANKWLIVQRFDSDSHLTAWKNSEAYQALLAELRPIITSIEDSKNGNEIQAGVTEVFVTNVSPDKEKHYREWIAKMHFAESKYPGFKGTYIQSPGKGSRNWITFLQFDTPENLDNWITSKERLKILEEGKELISSLENHRMISPFAGWFKGISQNGEAPPAWKQGMLVLLVLFPIVMLEIKLLNPHLQTLNPSLATFIGNSISVALVTWPLMPIAIWALGWWLVPNFKHKKLITCAGFLLIAALYLIEIFSLWHLI